MKRIHSSPMRGGGASFASRLRGALTLVFGALGVAGFAIIVLPLFGLTAVVLTTGSMAPGLPAGSIVISRDIPAADVTPGDVVTVGRADAAPVTHRVTAVQPTEGSSDDRQIQMQGDANRFPDPQPYVVDHVGLAVFSVPWGGQLVLALRTPWVIALVTSIIGALVLWSWWPEKE